MVRTTNTRQELSKEYFTIVDAERLLPKIEGILRKTIRINKALDLLGSIEIEVYDDDYNNLRRITKMNKQFHKLSYEFYAKIENLEDIGCIIKDIDVGILDFYSRYAGKDIFLCWKLGEKKIRFWHEIDSGYEGRKPILYLKNIK